MPRSFPGRATPQRECRNPRWIWRSTTAPASFLSVAEARDSRRSGRLRRRVASRRPNRFGRARDSRRSPRGVSRPRNGPSRSPRRQRHAARVPRRSRASRSGRARRPGATRCRRCLRTKRPGETENVARGAVNGDGARKRSDPSAPRAHSRRIQGRLATGEDGSAAPRAPAAEPPAARAPDAAPPAQRPHGAEPNARPRARGAEPPTRRARAAEGQAPPAPSVESARAR